MGLFGNKDKKNEGGLIDVIRCDEKEYLIWKWRPAGEDENSTKKENAIRYGSSLRVKDGEVAVFVYPGENGNQDFIEGPFDQTIKTGNFPVLAGIVGAAFGGSSPFQAEIYFINLAGLIQTRFAVPFFDVADPRFLDFTVPVAVRGDIRFKITDYKEFIKLHRLINFDLEDFKSQIKSAVSKYVKGVVANIPSEKGIPVIQLERKLTEINDVVEESLKKRLQNEFGITVGSVDIDAIDIDKTSDGYNQLKAVTQDITSQTIQRQTNANLTNMEETLRIQRESMAQAQRLQNETANLSAFQLEKQAEVGVEGAKAFGQMGENGAGNLNLGGGLGMNPAGMMAGMAMGSAIGQNMAGMVGGMMNGMNQQVPPQAQNIPPLPGNESYHVAVNGTATGPYTLSVLSTMAANGQFTKESLVWKQGMSNWEKAGSVSSLAGLFTSSVPPVPPRCLQCHHRCNLILGERK